MEGMTNEFDKMIDDIISATEDPHDRELLEIIRNNQHKIENLKDTILRIIDSSCIVIKHSDI